MTKLPPLLFLTCLGACGSMPHQTTPAQNGPTFSGPMLLQPASGVGGREEGGSAPAQTTLPVGVGLTLGPKALLLGGTLDFPLDEKITFGPSLQYAIDDNVKIASLTGQLKYFLPIHDTESGSFSFLPYATMGVGVGRTDKDGQDAEAGLLINGGAGVRYLTGKQYRIGSEARFNLLTEKLDGERSFFSFELLQVCISF